MNLDDEATGMAQTLANLFDNYPRNKLLFCTPSPASGKFKGLKTVAYKPALFEIKIITKLSPSFLRNEYFKRIKLRPLIKKILRFKPDLVLVSNLDYEPCLIADALLRKKKSSFCIYLMDYISDKAGLRFTGLMQSLMHKADLYVFISKYMAETCIAEYPGIKNWTVVHNPVNEKEIAEAPVINKRDTEISFAYAGSLWQMHMDAVILFAKAVKKLRSKGHKTNLVIYTQPAFYNTNKQVFEDLEIIYGGFHNFNQLKPYLLKHTALLVASSFDKNFYDLSAYSVQTKVTDYLASGVPVIAIGPGYAACNKFMLEHDCGFVIDSDNIDTVANEIEKYLALDITEIKQKAAKGLALITENYKKQSVQNKLYQFLTA